MVLSARLLDHDAGQGFEIRTGFVEGLLAPEATHQASQPGGEGGTGDVEFGVAGDHPIPAGDAVVVGATDRQGTQDRLDHLRPILHEDGLVPSPARHSCSPIAGIGL